MHTHKEKHHLRRNTLAPNRALLAPNTLEAAGAAGAAVTVVAGFPAPANADEGDAALLELPLVLPNMAAPPKTPVLVLPKPGKAAVDAVVEDATLEDVEEEKAEAAKAGVDAVVDAPNPNADAGGAEVVDALTAVADLPDKVVDERPAEPNIDLD
jgi:hypothetical protein